MKQAIVILPKKIKNLEPIRKKYDSFYKKFKTHISLVYTFEIKNQVSLVKHIKESIENIPHFIINFQKFYNSKNYVCLKVKSKECWNLYKLLNKGILSKFENKEVKFQPHITIAVLSTSKEAAILAKRLNKKRILSKIRVDSICLLTLKKDGSLKSIKKFNLKESTPIN